MAVMAMVQAVVAAVASAQRNADETMLPQTVWTSRDPYQRAWSQCFVHDLPRVREEYRTSAQPLVTVLPARYFEA